MTKNEEKQALLARLKTVEQATASKQAERHTNARPASQVQGVQGMLDSRQAPRARAGEDIMGSRGFQYLRAVGLAAGRNNVDAKIEGELCARMEKSFSEAGIFTSRGGHWVPFSMAHIPAGMLPQDLMRETRLMVKAGVDGADPDEMAWLSKKAGGYGKGYEAPGQKAVTGGMSYQTATDGGALVGPPGWGELIELFRNKAAVLEAGATVVPLPPTGQIQYPRQVGVTTGYWIGENTDITKSFPETGVLTLRAKKCAGYVVMPNDLLRYASVAAEALVRTDLSKTLALTADLAYMAGEGGNLKPEGILNTAGISTVTPTTVAADGDTLSPQDVYDFLAAVEIANAEFECFVMRPELFFKFVRARATTYSGSGQIGQFTFGMMRELGDKVVKDIGGFKVVTSNNVPKNRVKGSGSTLTAVIGGQWSDYYVGMFGALEFTQSDVGHTLLAADQCAIRGIMITDGAARHPAAFAVADNLLSSVGN